MRLVNNPIFLQSAGNNTPVVEEPVLRLMFNAADPTIQSVTGTGDIIIKSIKGGVETTQTVTDPSGDSISVQADKNTWIYLEGEVTELEHTSEKELVKLGAKNTALTQLNCSKCSVLQELNLSANTALTQLDCSYCYVLQTLDLSANTALTSLNCSSCYALQTLDLSANTALTELYCSDCPALQTLKYPATNFDVADAIAGAITDADADDGTVYTDSAADYYSTIADAATNKGWTIEQIVS